MANPRMRQSTVSYESLLFDATRLKQSGYAGALHSARHLPSETAISAAVMRSCGRSCVQAVMSRCSQSGQTPAADDGQTGRAPPDARVSRTSSSDRPWYGVAAFVYT